MMNLIVVNNAIKCANTQYGLFSGNGQLGFIIAVLYFGWIFEIHAIKLLRKWHSDRRHRVRNFLLMLLPLMVPISFVIYQLSTGVAINWVATGIAMIVGVPVLLGLERGILLVRGSCRVPKA